MAGMSPLEARLIRDLIDQKTGMRAKVGGAVDMAGSALGVVDNALTPGATKLQDAIVSRVGKLDPKLPPKIMGNLTEKGKVLAMLSGPQATMLAKAALGLGAVGGVVGAADVIAGPDSLGNKAMDTAAMGIGGFLGAPLGPLGIAAGAGTGKMVSDATQFIFGDKKSAEERKMEELLAILGK